MKIFNTRLAVAGEPLLSAREQTHVQRAMEVSGAGEAASDPRATRVE